MLRLLLIAAAAFWTGTAAAQPAPPKHAWSSLSAGQWREDLAHFARAAPATHRNFYHAMSAAEFQAAVRKLDASIPSMSTGEIVVGFMRLGAMIGDAHSSVNLDELALPRAPVRFIELDDGVYVEAADRAHADLVGAKLLSVGPVDWKKAMAAIDELVSDDAGNDGQKKVFAAHSYLNTPFILRGLGLSDAAGHATYTVEKAGRRRTVTLDASVPTPEFSVADLVFDPIPDGWVSARPVGPKVPLSAGHPDKLYWFQPIPEHDAVYVSIRAMIDGPGQTLAVFAQQLGEYLKAHAAKRIIVDLRGNPGGDNTLLRPLLLTLIRSDANHRGGLWVLIGPKTHSAAQNFVDRLENFADPIFVGAPTSEAVNFYGDPTEIVLPNSHIGVALSTLYWQDKDPRDQRKATVPEIAVPKTFDQFVTGKDPALEIALAEPPPPTLEAIVLEAAAKSPEALAAAYGRYVEDPRHRYVLDTERRLNRAGYDLLKRGEAAQAVEVFQLNAKVHSGSANAYDSLGEGLTAAGDVQAAVNAYKRVLELDPSSSHAAQELERLSRTPADPR
jgi:hypothetical protein